MSNTKVQVYQGGFPTGATVMIGRVIKIMPETAGEPWYGLRFNEKGQLVIRASRSIHISPEGSDCVILEFRQSE